MVVADGLVALALLWLATLFLTGAIQLWHVYVVILVRAVGQCFKMTAMFATTSLMVPEEQLSRVAGLNQLLRGLVLVAAPPLGALLLNALPFAGIAMVEVAGALLAIAPLLLVAIPQPERSSPRWSGGAAGHHKPAIPSLWTELADGLRYIGAWPGAVGMLVISMAVNFIARPAFTPGLVAILVVRKFAGGPTSLGWLAAAMGAGIIGGGLLLSLWTGFRRRMQTSLTGIIGMGLALLMIGLTPRAVFPLALGAIFAGGLMMSMCMTPIQALIQSTVTPSMQGRVITIMESSSLAVSPLSVWIAGLLFDAVGPTFWYVAGGLTAILIGAAGFTNPTILNLEAPGGLQLESEPEHGARDVATGHIKI
jgi:MFS transporter, DHA3 family, macrolide efflux protein